MLALALVVPDAVPVPEPDVLSVPDVTIKNGVVPVSYTHLTLPTKA